LRAHLSQQFVWEPEIIDGCFQSGKLASGSFDWISSNSYTQFEFRPERIMSAKVEMCGGGVEVAEIGGRPVLQPACNRVARANEGNNGKPIIRKSLKPSPPAPKASKPPCLQNVPSKTQTKSPSPPSSPSAKGGLLTVPSKHSFPRTQGKPPAITKNQIHLLLFLLLLLFQIPYPKSPHLHHP